MKVESESEIIMTYGDIYNEFCKKFPNVEIEDYRPAIEMYIPQLQKGIPNAIIVWLKDGSKVIYIAEKSGTKKGVIMEKYETSIIWNDPKKNPPKRNDAYICVIHGDLVGEPKPFISIGFYEDGVWDAGERINWDHVLAWAEVDIPEFVMKNYKSEL